MSVHGTRIQNDSEGVFERTNQNFIFCSRKMFLSSVNGLHRDAHQRKQYDIANILPASVGVNY